MSKIIAASASYLWRLFNLLWKKKLLFPGQFLKLSLRAYSQPCENEQATGDFAASSGILLCTINVE